ncbi:unnamed protein product [Ambrosiozyma monospora]|uniref:ATP-dependent RNA helicase DBP3 n=1 Tax=Ambrosiozyma monospora TaxID=43982 RepID=A0A9W6YS07_AMBMO|nr:unnamed protein product [Ambrosiozyma monospora]
MSKDELKVKDKKRKNDDAEDLSIKKKLKKDKKSKDKKEKKSKDKKSKDKKSKDKKEKKEKKHHKHKHHHHHDDDADNEEKEKEEGEAEEDKESKDVKKSTESAKANKSFKDNSNISSQEASEFLKTNEIEIEDPLSSTRKTPIQPALTFKSLENQIDTRIMKYLAKFPKPTPIQSVSWPYLLNGTDVIGVAETGSGKTLAFGVPAIDHVLKHPQGAKKGQKQGLRVLCVSPTRELATQIYDNLKELTDLTGLHCCCVYGGVPKHEQREQIKKSQCVVATPGRLVDLLNEGSISLAEVDYLVLDEADRMLEKGFEEDIKKIIGSTKPLLDRQTLMFTATWPKEVRELAAGFMQSPVKTTIGNRDELTANKRITQIVEVIDPRDKEKKLLQLLQKYHGGKHANDKVLIFALYKKEASRVERTLKYKGYDVAALHGDLSQAQRHQALDSFKKGECNMMLATDVAARGLDIPNVKTVINLTFPLTIEDYVHRIGRTGRAGQTGVAHTLFTEQEKHLAGALMNVLRGGDQDVPEDLLKFGSTVKKKDHSAYGAFFKNVDMTKKAKKVIFD